MKFWKPIAILSVVTLSLAFVTSFAGKFLIVDQPKPSDVIVVLAGDLGDIRMNRALQLSKQGYATRLVLDAPDWPIYGHMLSDLAREYIRNMAPDKTTQVRVCSYRDDSTLQELQQVSSCIRAFAPEARSAIIVTSNYHTRRALSTAKRVLPEYQWSAAAASDERFGIAWWKRREWAKTTLSEWQRWCWWTVVGQWSVRSS